MIEWVWLGINGIVGIPLALAGLVFLRESIRAATALAFGFRVFEIRWGIGRTLFNRPIGPINLVGGSWPLAGATLARSGTPRHHRIARAACAVAPLAAQLLWLAYRSADGPTLAFAFRDGPAFLAAMDLANTILLALHCFVPIEFASGVQSDVRLLLDSALTGTDSERAARANYYARLCRHRLERGDREAAEQALEQGLTQLGREAILVQCQLRFLETDLGSVVDQGECADELQRLIEAAEPNRTIQRASWSFGERFRQSVISVLPAGFLLLVVSIAEADRLALGVESLLHRHGEQVVSRNEATACTAQIERWTGWSTRTDRWFPLDDVERRDRHATLAELERCRGDLIAAAAHQGEAMLSANAARFQSAEEILAEPEVWLENELRMADLLRQAAAVESERRSYRRALGTLGKAERRLDSLRDRLAVWPDPDARSRADETITRARSEVVALREQVLASLAGN